MSNQAYSQALVLVFTINRYSQAGECPQFLCQAISHSPLLILLGSIVVWHGMTCTQSQLTCILIDAAAQPGLAYPQVLALAFTRGSCTLTGEYPKVLHQACAQPWLSWKLAGVEPSLINSMPILVLVSASRCCSPTEAGPQVCNRICPSPGSLAFW